MSSYSLGLASGGGVPPIKPTAFVYQMVIFSIEAPPDVIWGVGGREWPSGLVDVSQGVEDIKALRLADLQHTKIGTGRQ